MKLRDEDSKSKCCYITVDSAIAASQNGLVFTSFPFTRENQYNADYDKKLHFINLIFYSQRNCETR
jgi:hypothetical protein